MTEKALVTPANEKAPVYVPPRINLGPTSFSELEKFAKLLSNSNFVPAAMRGKPGDILAAVQFGAEVGLPPMQALVNIAVINGKPSIYGDAIPGICMRHPDWEGYEEEFDEGAMTATCTVRRRGMKPVIKSFSQADAEKAGLWRKPGPWTQYTKQMLEWRAKGFSFRAAFPDALKGLISREEAGDYITLPAEDYKAVANPPLPAPEPQPESMLPEELDSRIHDMEYAFSRGTGEDWWSYNYPPIRSRCTPEQRQRITARKNELKGAGASSEASGESPLPPVSSEDATSKPRGRIPRKSAEPSEKASIVAEGANKSEALLSDTVQHLLQLRKEYIEKTGSDSEFWTEQQARIDAMGSEDINRLHLMI